MRRCLVKQVNNINHLLGQRSSAAGKEDRSPLWQKTSNVAPFEFSRIAGVASGVGFSTYSACSLQSTPMHHRGVFFGRRLCSNAATRHREFHVGQSELSIVSAGQGANEDKAVIVPLRPADGRAGMDCLATRRVGLVVVPQAFRSLGFICGFIEGIRRAQPGACRRSSLGRRPVGSRTLPRSLGS